MTEQQASSTSDKSNGITRESTARAGIAGAGSGTLLIVIANKLNPNNPLKDYLILAAPSVSVFLGGFWLWFQVKIANKFRDLEVQTIFNKTKKVLEEALKNPKTSTVHKKQLKLQLEALELEIIRRQMGKIESLKFITEEEIIEKIKST